MARVTISDVAKRAGVAMGTVSNMLNHPEKVRPETREIISRAIKELGFVPNRNASVLAGGRNPVFGLVLTGLDHAFSLQVSQGVYDAAREAGFDLMITSADNDDILANHYVDYFRGARMSGIIVEPRPGADWRPDWPDDIPTVVLDYRSDSCDLCQVCADNVQAGVVAAEHAARIGRRRVAVISASDDIQSLNDRWRGIRSVADHAEIINVDDWRNPRSGYEAGVLLAERDDDMRPDFVIALTDVLAAGCIDGVLSRGYSVPDDIAVMGCDGNPLAWGGPIPMTTIEPHGYEMGRAAVELLVDEIRHADEHRHTVRTIPSRLLIRKSTDSGRH
ncbi:LacI family DNA-binding transcriptional regulator [Bifidobacterium sp. 82T24]|uniref:LacI family DNA-binding transcriptional regulator n=1 Tax=Bifidobacterium pluvialisilvae TaxID=2834436 RepID=UPI001C59CA69|nr:LacI family DNA-binding transcriptional regulator [Bifidobacterium pluvialisilvae]MBW3088420.1 LacI family DNA-binding transcriptional regulator [Bifidobacterium pluvialisilvae]